VNATQKGHASLTPVDLSVFDGFLDRSTSFDGLATYRNAGFNITVGNRPERAAGQFVSAGFFDTVGVRPMLGRGIAENDCAPGAPPVLVISDRAWTEIFDRRADIIGFTVRLNGAPATIVGVMPEPFTSFMEGRGARVWSAWAREQRTAPGGPAGNVIGRLKPGVSLERAQAEIAAVHTSLAASFPDALGDRAAVVRDFRSALFGGLGPGIRMLAVIVGLLLLIACGNAANLLLSRSAEQTRDVALRAALGASRLRLVATLLAASLWLSAAASAVGLLLAYWGTRLVWAGAGAIFARIGVDGFAFDGRVVTFAVGLTVIATALFGVGPALQGSRADLAGTLKAGAAATGRGPRAGRISRWLVVGQVALCVVTLVVAALMVRSFAHFSHLAASPGFDPRPFLVASLPTTVEPGDRSGQRLSFTSTVEARIAASPGVESVALADRLPFLESGRAVVVRGHLRRAAAAESSLEADARTVNAAYFATFSVPILRGRTIAPEDTEQGRQVVVIDERLANAGWGTADPVGDQVVVDGVPRTIVGVVGSNVEPSPFRPAPRELFLPYRQALPAAMKVVVRSPLSADVVAGLVRRGVAAVDRDQPVTEVQPLAQALDDFMTPFRLLLSLISLFGAVALGLAALGLYSVISRGVSRRTREIGIRMAMGATRREVVSLVLREARRPALTGLVLGLLLGLAASSVLPSEILGVRGLAPWHYLAAIVVWLAAAALACIVPARRAAAVDPLAALRCD
jgi:putative ABC transport system permease protein